MHNISWLKDEILQDIVLSGLRASKSQRVQYFEGGIIWDNNAYKISRTHTLQCRKLFALTTLLKVGCIGITTLVKQDSITNTTHLFYQ